MTSVATHSKSNTLTSRIEELAKNRAFPTSHTENYKTADLDSRQDHLIATLEARLWTMIQRKLYDPLAARRLKPLQPLPPHNSMILEDPNEMLDESTSSFSVPNPRLGQTRKNSDRWDFNMLLDDCDDLPLDLDDDLLDDYDGMEASNENDNNDSNGEEDAEIDILDESSSPISPPSRTNIWTPWLLRQGSEADDELLLSD